MTRGAHSSRDERAPLGVWVTSALVLAALAAIPLVAARSGYVPWEVDIPGVPDEDAVAAPAGERALAEAKSPEAEPPEAEPPSTRTPATDSDRAEQDTEARP